MSSVGYGISDRVGQAEWDRMTANRLEDLHRCILADDARVVRAAFFAPRPGSGDPPTSCYQIAFRESTDKKLHAYEFYGRHKRLPISVNSTYFDDSKWVFTNEVNQQGTAAPKRKASSGPRKSRAKPKGLKQEDIEEDDEDDDEDDYDEDQSVAGSVPPMQRLEEWAALTQPRNESYEDDISGYNLRNSRRRLESNQGSSSSPSLLSRLTPRLGENNVQRPVDFRTHAPAPSESGFSSTTDGKFSTSSEISSASSNVTVKQLPVRRSARLGSAAPSVCSSTFSRELNMRSRDLANLQVDNDMSLENESILDYEEGNSVQHAKREDYADVSMDGASSIPQDEVMQM